MSTKEAAIEALVKKHYDPTDSASFNSGVAFGIRVGYESARSKWTAINSVEDLPKEDGEYLVTFDYQDESSDRFLLLENFKDGRFTRYHQRVTAWMPLPEPYQQGGE